VSRGLTAIARGHAGVLRRYGRLTQRAWQVRRAYRWSSCWASGSDYGATRKQSAEHGRGEEKTNDYSSHDVPTLVVSAIVMVSMPNEYHERLVEITLNVSHHTTGGAGTPGWPSQVLVVNVFGSRPSTLNQINVTPTSAPLVH
jgi:hypothetical protein